MQGTLKHKGKYGQIAKTSLLLIIIIIAASAFLYFHHKNTSKTSSNGLSAVNIHTASSNNKASSTNPDVPTPTPTTSVPGATEDNSNSNVAAPSGVFASVPNATLSTSEYSTCNSTPGATCLISFKSKSNGQIISLNKETVATNSKDAQDSSAIWSSWTPSQIGLSQGSWQMSATATLNGSSQTTVSQTELVIQ